MKGVQSYELFGGIALKNHSFSFKEHIVNRANSVSSLIMTMLPIYG